MSDLKIEVVITTKIQLDIANRVRHKMYELVKKEIPGTTQADIITTAELIKQPGWNGFLERCAKEVWDEDVLDDLASTVLFDRDMVANAFPTALEDARAAANTRRAAKSKSFKVKPTDAAKVKKLLREQGIDFE